MVRSEEIFEEIQCAFPKEDWKDIEAIIADIQHMKGRKARKNIIIDINKAIIETALKNNKPTLLLSLPNLQSNEIDELFSRIIKQYISTKDETWLQSVSSLSEKLDKKSNQSRVFAMIARDLIDAGVSNADSGLIENGMVMLDRISFRKYRSGIMIDIIPLLIVWAITARDQQLLYTSLHLIEDIGDISKRAVLHAELAKALATISILKKDRSSFFKSIRSATDIHQKIRRQNCLSFIIDKGAKSGFGKEMTDIPLFMNNFNEVTHDAYLEIISFLTEQLLERVKEKKQIINILQTLCEDKPEVAATLILDLLKKAERSGDKWFLSTAMKLHQHQSGTETCPTREIVRAGISVARNSNEMQVLTDLIPLIEKNCNSAILSRIYLQFSQIMLSSGDFNSALEIFGKITQETENLPQFADSLSHLLKKGIANDKIPLINNTILESLKKDVANNAIYRAIIEVSKDNAFKDIIEHSQSIKSLISLHPKKDNLILESITILVDRGFLDIHDPEILIQLAESIDEQSLKERAISNIVIKIAKIGVRTKNRDFLQRAVGLTCEIDGQNTRSATLSSIIDDASILAAQQGDLDLLLRMKVWSSSLLEKDLATYAMANIIDGVIKYAIDKESPDALEEAHLIASDINDPSLKTQLFERITECFVKIGCILIKDSRFSEIEDYFISALQPFERGLQIIKRNIKSPQISLKIAGIIDIIISYARTSNNRDYIIPMAMYAIEIENSYERDAMMSRIISSLDDDILSPNSTDPYEIMALLLQRNDVSKSNPVIIRLRFQVLQLINDPYLKLKGLCNLADSSIIIHDYSATNQILDNICKDLRSLPAEYQKVLILSDLTTLSCRFDAKFASQCLRKGIKQLKYVEFDKDAMARRQIVFAIVSLNAIEPDAEWSDIALEVVQKISDPVEYINSLIAVYSIVQQDKERCSNLLHFMENAVEKISSPYEKAFTLLNIIPLSLQNSDDITSLDLLKKTDALAKKINIQSIADTFRDNIARIYTMLYQKNNNNRFLSLAIQITKSIDDEDLRFNRLKKMGYTQTYDTPPLYLKIKALSEKMVADGVHPNQITSLERLVRSVADRGKEAIFFCDLAIFFREKGEEKVSRRMIQNSIKEARIIRPLSRRSFVICDIALKIYSAGWDTTAQEVLDFAIDAATNIRQSSIRDEVFDELGLAIKIMHGL